MADATCDDEILQTARAVLDDRIGILEAVQTLSSHRSSESNLVSADDYNLFRAIESETDHLPVGAVRQHWHPDSLIGKDAEIARYEELSRNLVRAACERILANGKKTHSGYYDKTKCLDFVLPMSVDEQIEWLAQFGMFLTIAARFRYPVQMLQVPWRIWSRLTRYSTRFMGACVIFAAELRGRWKRFWMGWWKLRLRADWNRIFFGRYRIPPNICVTVSRLGPRLRIERIYDPRAHVGMTAS